MSSSSSSVQECPSGYTRAELLGSLSLLQYGNDKCVNAKCGLLVKDHPASIGTYCRFVFLLTYITPSMYSLFMFIPRCPLLCLLSCCSFHVYPGMGPTLSLRPRSKKAGIVSLCDTVFRHLLSPFSVRKKRVCML